MDKGKARAKVVAVFRRNACGTEWVHELDYPHGADSCKSLYTTGNFGCDCNRDLFFHWDVLNVDTDDRASYPEDLPCGNSAYTLVSLKYNGKELL